VTRSRHARPPPGHDGAAARHRVGSARPRFVQLLLAALSACGRDGSSGERQPSGAAAAAAVRAESTSAAHIPPTTASIATLPAPVETGARATPPPARGAVLTGIDVLVRDGFRALRGRRLGLITNGSAVDRLGRRTVDRLHGAPGVELLALFSPEHGLEVRADGPVGDGVDPRTGLPVHSLYGARRRPTAEALRGLDTLVFDLQDAGARFFTYTTTLGYALESAAEHHLRMVILDRPNPIGGVAVEGPLLDPDRTSFIGYHPLPIRHGMTLGELGRLFNEERRLGAHLEVIRMEGWRRGDLMDRTGLPWVNPSPNLRSLSGALLYPGVALLEFTNVSVGRGTARPFEQIGAPWIDGAKLAAALSARALPGVRFEATSFTPSASTHAGVSCSGVAIALTDTARIGPVKLGLALADDLRRLFGAAFELGRVSTLLGNRAALDALTRGETVDRVAATWAPSLAAFLDVRRRHLLY
jgi:uncharacterized protein YbbC (DUF1343 family)